MLRLLAALCLLLCPTLAAAQPSAAERWRQTEDRATFLAAGIGFPDRAGSVALRDIGESSRRGEGLDNVLQYRSADGQVFATAYVYLPGLAHAGLAAYVTDRAILGNSSESRVRVGTRGPTAAGGRADVALLAEYGNYRGGLASRAAFVKVGRWMVKLRVSGPQARADEVASAMAALLAGLSFEGGIQPTAAVEAGVADCDDPDGADAAPAPARPDEILAYAAVAARDGGASPSRLPARWCLSRMLAVPGGSVPLLRAADRGGAPDGSTGRSVAYIPLNDAGGALELIETPENGRFVLLVHGIGETRVLGIFAGVPSDRQFLAILNGADQASRRTRAIVRIRPDGETRIELGDDARGPTV